MTQTAPTIETTKPAQQFNADDRCDAGGCGAQAYAAASFTGGQLLFCGHHFKRYQTELEKQAYAVIDNTDAITGK